tara:strand:+ start:38 stop:595 length:558 start_codon:yes stop_codon:yes gene_type:complete
MTDIITQLKNPKTVNYQRLKKDILSDQFTWYYNSSVNYKENGLLKNQKIPVPYNEIPFFSHSVIGRPLPGHNYSTIRDKYISEFQKVFDEIFSYNKLELNCFYRMNVNLVQPTKDQLKIPFHTDHPWPHKNILIYLTNAGGETICEDESFNPSEDDIITFSGYPEKHCHKTSIEKNRIVIVATYI